MLEINSRLGDGRMETGRPRCSPIVLPAKGQPTLPNRFVLESDRAPIASVTYYVLAEPHDAHKAAEKRRHHDKVASRQTTCLFAHANQC